MILTDQSHMPIGSVNTLHNHSRAAKNIYNQINWSSEAKRYLWTEIIRQKIKSQKETLLKVNHIDKNDILDEYIHDIEIGDPKNREGIASRIYFKELFGQNFKRFNIDIINFAMNYVYQVIRSKISQEIVNLGYEPSLGIFHRSEFNNFNLADDFIEVFRPIVDYYVYEILYHSDNEYLTSEIKIELVNILNKRVNFKNAEHRIHNCISLYLQDCISFLETGDINKVKFPTLIC
jgi:CRISPR-associated protein Cas1